MLELKILNRKKIKEILALIKEQWGADFSSELVFLMNDKGKIFLVNKEVFDLPLEKLKINSIGLYFGELKNNELRLSIEGSQLIGKDAKQNLIEINEKQAMQWLKGQDVDADGNYRGFVILKHENDFLGTGKYKDEKVLNFVPKARRFKYNLEIPD
ncbi:MAG: tRNA pseudouridine(55) synthase TruB [Nanoarchaeota archaeon]|nr:tRNA pseudouridine(55) synthase TruB [Nanoarchaeota archaeon]